MLNLAIYCFYLAVSLLITIHIGKLLSQNGLVFLTHQLDGNKSLALTINNLLLIGYYLINIGYILLVLNLGASSMANGELNGQIYFLTRNLGLVTLMLGAMHMILLYVLANWNPRVSYTEEQ